MMTIGICMITGTSFAFAFSGFSCPKKTAWVTLMKEANVMTETIRAVIVAIAKRMLPDSTAFV